jgi:hypothetical protein
MDGAANGSSEPKLTDAAWCSDARYHERAKNLQQLLEF